MDMCHENEILALQAIFKPEEFYYSQTASCGFLNLQKQKVKFYVEFELPDTYPDYSPPNFTLAASDLSDEALHTLAKELIQLWKRHKGEAILYEWFQYLSEVSYTTDEALEQCEICFEDVPSADLQSVGSHCAHSFCRECLKHYAEAEIDSRSALIHCPDSQCKEAMSYECLQAVASLESFNKYDQRLLELYIVSIPNMVWCPRLACQYPAHGWPEEGLAVCPSCCLAFCMRCKRTYHGVNPCQKKHLQSQDISGGGERKSAPTPLSTAAKDLYMLNKVIKKKGVGVAMKIVYETVRDLFSHLNPFEHRQIKDHRLNHITQPDVRKAYEEFYGAAFLNYFISSKFSQKDLKQLLEDLAEEAELDKDSAVLKSNSYLQDDEMYRSCPGCFALVEKIGGCSHMSCDHCRLAFCWNCMQDRQQCLRTFCGGRFATKANLHLALRL